LSYKIWSLENGIKGGKLDEWSEMGEEEERRGEDGRRMEQNKIVKKGNYSEGIRYNILQFVV
jgi:hypothetical protein